MAASMDDKRLLMASLALFTIMLIFIGMIANSVVIIAIAGERKMRNSPMYLLLANLAFADYAFLISTLTSIVLIGFDLTSGANAYLFSLSSYLATAALTVSIYTNVAVCIERFVTVAHPLHFKRIFHPLRVAGFIVFLWMIVTIYYIPHYVPPGSCPTINGTDEVDWSACSGLFYGATWWRIYKVFDCIVCYAVPIVVLSLFYRKTCKVLWSPIDSLYEGLPIQKSSDASSTDSTRLSVVLASRRDVVKMLILCVVVFYACYTLSTVSNVIKSVTGNHELVPEEVDFISLVMLVIASSMNPFVYTMYSVAFRERLRQMTPCRAFSGLPTFLKSLTSVKASPSPSK